MKFVLFITTILFTGYSSSSQQINPYPALNKQDYLIKSKNEKTTAWILAGGGLAMSSVTLAIAASENAESTTNFLTTVIDLSTNSDSNTDDKTSLTGIFFYIGAACIISSVPLFISASKNKRKAMSISFINQSLPQLPNNNFVYRAIPSLKLKISI